MKLLDLLAMLLAMLLLFSSPLIVSAQQENDNCLIVRSRVLEVPDSGFFRETYPPEGAYVIVTYKVLKVLKGSYEDDDIKVSHGVISSRKLRVGDQVVMEIKPFKDLREEADFFRGLGVEMSEDRLADFVLVQFHPTFGSLSRLQCTNPDSLIHADP
jgi:hypothetical protein